MRQSLHKIPWDFTFLASSINLLLSVTFFSYLIRWIPTRWAIRTKRLCSERTWINLYHLTYPTSSMNLFLLRTKSLRLQKSMVNISFLKFQYVTTFSIGVITLPVFDTMTHLIARISNRVFFGPGLCRNEQYLHVVVRFAETLGVMARFIQWSPSFLRPWVSLTICCWGFYYESRLVYFVLSSILGGKKAPLKHIIPFMIDRQSMNEKPVVLSLLTWSFTHADARYLEPRFGTYDSECSFSWNYTGSGGPYVKY